MSKLKLTKEEKSRLLNQLLSTEIDFTRLKKEDLDTLFDLFNNLDELFFRLIENAGIDVVAESLNKAIKRKIIEAKPLLSLIKRLLT